MQEPSGVTLLRVLQEASWSRGQRVGVARGEVRPDHRHCRRPCEDFGLFLSETEPVKSFKQMRNKI